MGWDGDEVLRIIADCQRSGHGVSSGHQRKDHKVTYLLVKHQVTDFAKWKRVFDLHREGQRDSGLELLYLVRDIEDRNMVVLFFRVVDLERAKAFFSTPEAYEAAEISGVEGEPEALWLAD